ncbi:rolling circle replication-associated protein [Dysgonomonas macrotermitis]|uniref:Replication-associated protein ORF2/G2P domain-containing protein n=1 Tax=Dysgonomonas macrotermitis TaxID=1346286 RepID=A0A1M5AGT8_9BACT|nr:hypothetical protein [Dysgonomonas macrotermitis]SHF29354.1 hypothetical protein SAMN05444362_10544 [Dysgonomonas macrotermitis]
MENKKNGGIIPAVPDERVLMVPAPCGKCIECMKKKAREWSIRLQEENKAHTVALFVTLSFSEDSLRELDRKWQERAKKMHFKQKLNKIDENEIATIAVRLFLERYRKKYKKSLRHWLVTELGSNNTERIHLHGIIYCVTGDTIEKYWQYGNVWIGDYVNQKTINYIVKYMYKNDGKHKGYVPKVLCSPGIGSLYTRSVNYQNMVINKSKIKDQKYRFTNGQYAPLPTYYKNKLYDEDERQELWIDKLDQEVRYIMGERISIKGNDERDYYASLSYYQQMNNQLGYGDRTKEWSLKNYKEQRKKLQK